MVSAEVENAITQIPVRLAHKTYGINTATPEELLRRLKKGKRFTLQYSHHHQALLSSLCKSHGIHRNSLPQVALLVKLLKEIGHWENWAPLDVELGRSLISWISKKEHRHLLADAELGKAEDHFDGNATKLRQAFADYVNSLPTNDLDSSSSHTTSDYEWEIDQIEMTDEAEVDARPSLSPPPASASKAPYSWLPPNPFSTKADTLATKNADTKTDKAAAKDANSKNTVKNADTKTDKAAAKDANSKSTVKEVKKQMVKLKLRFDQATAEQDDEEATMLLEMLAQKAAEQERLGRKIAADAEDDDDDDDDDNDREHCLETAQGKANKSHQKIALTAPAAVKREEALPPVPTTTISLAVRALGNASRANDWPDHLPQAVVGLVDAVLTDEATKRADADLDMQHAEWALDDTHDDFIGQTRLATYRQFQRRSDTSLQEIRAICTTLGAFGATRQPAQELVHVVRLALSALVEEQSICREAAMKLRGRR